LNSKLKSNLAIKCAWNDVGYRGKCLDCPKTNPSCESKAIMVSKYDCWERHLFTKYEFGVGSNRHIADFMIKKIVGKVVVFTTKKPNSLVRTVFAVAQIKNIKKEVPYPSVDGYPSGFSDMVEINPKLCIEIPTSISINFEQFYHKRWSQGLFRYLSNQEVKGILRDIKNKMQKIGYNNEEIEKIDQLGNISNC